MHLLALLNWPYGYFEFLRVATTVIAVALIYRSFVDSRIGFGIAASGAFYLWSPLFGVEMSRESWGIWNLSYALVFLMAAYSFKQSSAKSGS